MRTLRLRRPPTPKLITDRVTLPPTDADAQGAVENLCLSASGEFAGFQDVGIWWVRGLPCCCLHYSIAIYFLFLFFLFLSPK